MKRLMIGIDVAAALAGCAKCDKCEGPVMGNWGTKLPCDEISAGSVIFSRDADGAPKRKEG